MKQGSRIIRNFGDVVGGPGSTLLKWVPGSEQGMIVVYFIKRCTPNVSFFCCRCHDLIQINLSRATIQNWNLLIPSDWVINEYPLSGQNIVCEYEGIKAWVRLNITSQLPGCPLSRILIRFHNWFNEKTRHKQHLELECHLTKTLPHLLFHYPHVLLELDQVQSVSDVGNGFRSDLCAFPPVSLNTLLNFHTPTPTKDFLGDFVKLTRLVNPQVLPSRMGGKPKPKFEDSDIGVVQNLLVQGLKKAFGTQQQQQQHQTKKKSINDLVALAVAAADGSHFSFRPRLISFLRGWVGQCMDWQPPTAILGECVELLCAYIDGTEQLGVEELDHFNELYRHLQVHPECTMKNPIKTWLG